MSSLMGDHCALSSEQWFVARGSSSSSSSQETVSGDGGAVCRRNFRRRRRLKLVKLAGREGSSCSSEAVEWAPQLGPEAVLANLNGRERRTEVCCAGGRGGSELSDYRCYYYEDEDESVFPGPREKKPFAGLGPAANRKARRKQQQQQPNRIRTKTTTTNSNSNRNRNRNRNSKSNCNRNNRMWLTILPLLLLGGFVYLINARQITGK